MTDIWLGVIAVSVLVMALVQLAMAVAVLVVARRGLQAAERLERDIRPLLMQAQTVAADAARAVALAADRVERADAALTALATRVEQAASAFARAVWEPARRGLARFGRRRPSSSEEESGPSRAESGEPPEF